MNPISPAPFLAPRIASGKATASLVLGIVGLLTSVTIVPSMLAVIFGHLATDETRSGRRAGHGQAVAGIVLGYLVVVPLTAVGVVLAVLGIRQLLT